MIISLRGMANATDEVNVLSDHNVGLFLFIENRRETYISNLARIKGLKFYSIGNS